MLISSNFLCDLSKCIQLFSFLFTCYVWIVVKWRLINLSCALFEKHVAQLNIDGGLFYLHIASGQSEIADVLSKKKTSRLVYESWLDFVNKFSTTLPLGSTYKWDHKVGLSAWQDSVIYHSFLLHSEQGKSPHFYKF